LKSGQILIKNVDVGRNYAEFANNFYVFRNYIFRAIFMPNFRSLAHLYQKLTRGGGVGVTPSHLFSVHQKANPE